METLRRRIPFQVSEEGQEEDRVLDEEEQEHVIKELHKENNLRTRQYYKILQLCIGITLFLQLLFLFLPRARTPLHMVHPNLKTPLPPLIPFSTIFTMLNMVSLLNGLLYLPTDMALPHALLSVINQIKFRLSSEAQEAVNTSLPFPVAWGVILPSLAPFVGILAGADVPQIIWWAFPAFVMGTVALVISWIKDTEAELMGLEKLKYEAKGA